MQNFMKGLIFVKIVQQLLEVVLQFMNASAMTDSGADVVIRGSDMAGAENVNYGMVERKASSGGMVLHPKSGSAGRKDHCRQLSQ